MITITPKTKWSKKTAIIWGAVSPENKRKYYAVVQRYYGVNFWEQRINFICDLIEKPESVLQLIPPSNTAFAVIFYESIGVFLGDFIKAVQAYTPTENTGNKRIKFSFRESVLIESQKYFNLQSFEIAMDIYIGDYLLMKKATYNEWLTEKAKIEKLKNKHKPR